MGVFQVADLTEQLASKTDADDAIMVAVDNKIEEWKVCVSFFAISVSEYYSGLKKKFLNSAIMTENYIFADHEVEINNRIFVEFGVRLDVYFPE